MAKPESNLVSLARLEEPSINPRRPGWGVYEHPVRNERGRTLKPGVYRHTCRTADDATQADADRALVDEWIATPVTVIARTINSDDGSEGRLLRLVTDGGGVREWAMPMEMFGGSGEDARRALFAMGAIISPRKRNAFMEYLLEQRPSTVYATTSRPGWHSSGAFVLPRRTIGGDNVRFQGGGEVDLFTTRGDLAAWQALIASRCQGNPVLTLAIGCALAGPLLSLVGVLGGGVHLVGDSSSGKSLAQLVGASVWGPPKLFAASWDMSKGGLEIEASSRNDTLLPLDEIKRADPKRVQEMAYALSNGQGKGTMDRNRQSRAKLSWCVLALSSGERSLSEHAAIAGSPAHAGAELRMVDVNAGTRTYRAFDELHGMEGAAFHRALTVATSQHYGHLGPAFVECLLHGNDRTGLEADFGRMRASFESDNAQAGRVADRFAVIALASEMAIAYGLLPWPAGTALADARLLYAEWLARVGSGNAEDRQILTGVADFIDRHGSSRFSDIEAAADDDRSRVYDRAGYWHSDAGRRLYLFNRPALLQAAQGYGVSRIAKALDAAGAIAKRDIGRQQASYRLPGGGKAKFYAINPEALEGAA